MQIRQDVQLTTVNADANRYIPVSGFDAISVMAKMIQGSTFDSGVITFKKANCINGDLEDLNATPVTMSAAGIKDLALADFAKTQFIVAKVTTASTGAARVELVFDLNTLGFSLT